MPCFAAWALWFLGRPDQALERIEEALALARELSEPHGLAHAFFFATVLYQLRREAPRAQEHAETVIAVSSKHGLVMYEAMATVLRGWALIERDRKKEGIEQLRQGLADLQTTGTELMRPHFLALQADAFGKAHQPEEALRILEQSLEMAHRNGDASYLAELYRLKGELILIQATGANVSRAITGGSNAFEDESTAVAEAEGSFKQSIEIARQQMAKSWEIRAVISLARLCKNQGKQEQGRVLLARIYDTFTEGFDTTDLREAKALLDELS